MMNLFKHRCFIALLFIVTVISLFVISFKSELNMGNLHLLVPISNRNNSQVQHDRKDRVRSVCKNRGKYDPARWILKPSDFHALHFDDENKIIYCEVPKVACSNWKRVLLMLSGKIKAESLSDIPVNEVHSKLSKKYLKRMSELTLPEISRRLDPTSKYFKFVFVREPFERLVSAYRNKFVAPYSKYFQKRFGRYIIRHIRYGNSSKESMERGHDVTFPEFIRFITKKNIIEFGDKANAHWRPVTDLCLPCIVNYNFIGKYETMKDGDVEYVLNQLKAKHLSFPPAYNSGSNRTANLVAEHYKNVPYDDILKIREIFKNDFQMFYPKNNIYDM